MSMAKSDLFWGTLVLVDHLLMLTTFSGPVGGQLRQVLLYLYFC
jgi:hypothetical protein